MHFGAEALVAAEDLAKQKHGLEREMEKVKIDIGYRERAVTNEKVIAEALLHFEKTVKALPFDEQCELLRLILRQIQINRIDPKKDPIPSNPHTWSTQIRTQWYAVNLSHYANDLISGKSGTNTGGSHSAQSGGEGGIRTPGTF